jgi:hypothetical protein
MDLGTTASGTVVWCLSNPATAAGAKPVSLFIKRLTARGNYIGIAGATRVPIGFARATGTAAGGSGNAATTSLAPRRAGTEAPIALFRWGPTAITGMTPDTPGDFKTVMIPSQIGPEISEELVTDNLNMEVNDPLEIAPGTSLIATLRGISIAGTGAVIDVEWGEK